jgi:hypothetical protein
MKNNATEQMKKDHFNSHKAFDTLTDAIYIVTMKQCHTETEMQGHTLNTGNNQTFNAAKGKNCSSLVISVIVFSRAELHSIHASLLHYLIHSLSDKIHQLSDSLLNSAFAFK